MKSLGNKLRKTIKLFGKPLSLIRSRTLGTICNVNTNQPVVALTFDDGPDADSTPRLLEILGKYEAKATFFIVGTQAQKHPDIVKRIAEEGHCIGNHTFEHLPLPLLNRKQRQIQIEKCAKMLEPYMTRIIRPPFGYLTLPVCVNIIQMGYKIIGWNTSTYDWLDKDADFICQHFQAGMQPGNIFVLHDNLYCAEKKSYFDRTPLIRAVERTLSQFSGKFKFVTVPDLLKYGRVRRKYWYLAPDIDVVNSLIYKDGMQRQFYDR